MTGPFFEIWTWNFAWWSHSPSFNTKFSKKLAPPQKTRNLDIFQKSFLMGISPKRFQIQIILHFPIFRAQFPRNFPEISPKFDVFSMQTADPHFYAFASVKWAFFRANCKCKQSLNNQFLASSPFGWAGGVKFSSQKVASLITYKLM
jgi:hypothetical protein